MSVVARRFVKDAAPGGRSTWGCKRAVDGFMADKPELLHEIADHWGSAYFRKI